MFSIAVSNGVRSLAGPLLLLIARLAHRIADRGAEGVALTP